jgi:hypothetical protein
MRQKHIVYLKVKKEEKQKEKEKRYIGDFNQLIYLHPDYGIYEK